MSPSILQREPLPSRTEASLETLIAESSIRVLVNFQEPWSPMMVAPLGRLAKAFAGHLQVVRVNIAAHPELAARFKIRVVPTVLIFERGVPVEFIVGIVPEHFLFETVQKVLDVGSETPKDGRANPSGQWLRKSQGNRPPRRPVRPRPGRLRGGKLAGSRKR